MEHDRHAEGFAALVDVHRAAVSRVEVLAGRREGNAAELELIPGDEQVAEGARLGRIDAGEADEAFRILADVAGDEVVGDVRVQVAAAEAEDDRLVDAAL